MNIYYYSGKTKNTEHFCCKLKELHKNINIYDLQKISKPIKDEYVLVFPTYGKGIIPKPVKEFIIKYISKCKGIIGTGQRNFGKDFAVGAEKACKKFNVPLIMKVELQGSSMDFHNFEVYYNNIKG